MAEKKRSKVEQTLVASSNDEGFKVEFNGSLDFAIKVFVENTIGLMYNLSNAEGHGVSMDFVRGLLTPTMYELFRSEISEIMGKMVELGLIDVEAKTKKIFEENAEDEIDDDDDDNEDDDEEDEEE